MAVRVDVKTDNFDDRLCYGNSASFIRCVFCDVRTYNLIERCQRFEDAICLHCQGVMKMDEGSFSKIVLVYKTVMYEAYSESKYRFAVKKIE